MCISARLGRINQLCYKSESSVGWTEPFCVFLIYINMYRSVLWTSYLNLNHLIHHLPFSHIYFRQFPCFPPAPFVLHFTSSLSLHSLHLHNDPHFALWVDNTKLYVYSKHIQQLPVCTHKNFKDSPSFLNKKRIH